MPDLLHGLTPAEPADILAPPQPAAPAAPVTPELYDFGDVPATRKRIFDKVLTSAKSFPGVENSVHRLALTDVDYEGPESYSLKDQKKAILESQTLGRRLRGTWQLLDKTTGQELARKRSTLASVPYLTDAGTYILNGSKYTLANQLRLRPGVYAREKENGELEAHINVLPGKGLTHRLNLDPETGVFRMNVGQAQLPLMPILKAFGVTDAQLREAWGPQLWADNQRKNESGTLQKLYQRLMKGQPPTDAETARAAVTAALAKMELDPKVTQRTLGQAFTHVGPDQILATTKKLLAINHGEQDIDDRDNLTYQTLHGPEDLLAERVGRDKRLLTKLLWKAGLKKSLDNLQPNLFQKSLMSAITDSGLGNVTEEVNPAMIMEQMWRVSRLGVGGIPGDAVPMESRSVNPSYMGFVDPLITPECYDDQTEVMTQRGWVCWQDATRQDKYACMIDGRLEWRRPIKMHKSHYVGNMVRMETDILSFCVTPDHRLWVRPVDAGLPFRIETAEYAYRRCRNFQCAGHKPVVGRRSVKTFTLPPVAYGANNQRIAPPIPIGRWAAFLGWYLSEGSYWIKTDVPGKQNYNVKISQSAEANPHHYAEIDGLLAKLPFAYSKNEKGFCVPGKQLAMYCRQFGYCQDKFIPPEAFEWPIAARRQLLIALLKGDGRHGKYDPELLRGLQFSSTSRQLSEDVARLVFSLGLSCRIVVEKETRQPHYCDNHVVHIHSREQRSVQNRDQWSYEPYIGNVYCATVPGGLLYVRRDGKVGHWSGNSSRAGVDMRLTNSVRRGSDGKLYTPIIDMRSGQTVWKTPDDLADETVMFPGELRSGKKHVNVMQAGQLRRINRNKVQFRTPDFEGSFSPVANMVPMKSGMKGQRVSMAQRMITQALPLVGAEAPFVQSGVPDGLDSFEDRYGKFMGAVKTPGPGTVMSVTDEEITVRGDDGQTQTHELAKHVPSNRKTGLNHTATVQPGQRVVAGQLLARSNYTDAGGTTALGRNLRTGYLPYLGLNFEDAYVISESGSKKLESEHYYQHALDKDDDVRVGKRDYLNAFPGVHAKRVLAQMDDDGVIRPGSIVQEGDPLVLATKKKERTYSTLHNPRDKSFGDESQLWDHPHEGVVTDVSHTDKGVLVTVRTTMPMEVGDKLSGRFGDKGVISRIVPDHEMPRDDQGRPFEVLTNPLGVITRSNPSQVVEAMLGKIAERTGRVYKIRDTKDTDDLIQFAEDELRKHGLSDTETVTDPTSGDRKIPGVLTGNRFFMKLHHTSEGKRQGRSTGAYTAEGVPARGGETGSKKLGLLDSNALLSSGATEVIRDAALIRGQSNPDYWSQYMSGHKPATPDVTTRHKKFVAMLQGSGLNPVRQGSQLHVMAMTDKDIDTMAGDRELQNAETVDWRDKLKPIKGGLFDASLTGGHSGTNWAYIKLAEPMPNPAFEEPIRKLLDLTGPRFTNILAGREELKGMTGPAAISSALAHINVPRALEQARQTINSGRKTHRDAAIRKLQYLKGLEKHGGHPSDWILTKVPVLPPAFRPISIMQGSKLPMIADPNLLYRDLFEANTLLTQSQGQVDDVSDERLATYNAFKAVTGLGDPIQPKTIEKKAKGLLAKVFGTAPKYGFVQSKLLASNVDMVGRGVVIPDPDMDLDSVGIPEDQAWSAYNPHVIRRLVKGGMPRLLAARLVKDRDPRARKALVAEMDDRPVLITRAPTLHRYNVMAFKPRIVSDNTIHTSPLVVSGFGMDFDGDISQFHVPQSDEAVEDALQKLLPSKNLFSVSGFRAHQLPGKEYGAGLYQASTMRDDAKRPRTFATTADAIRAYKRGEIDVDQPVEIAGDD